MRQRPHVDRARVARVAPCTRVWGGKCARLGTLFKPAWLAFGNSKRARCAFWATLFNPVVVSRWPVTAASVWLIFFTTFCSALCDVRVSMLSRLFGEAFLYRTLHTQGKTEA